MPRIEEYGAPDRSIRPSAEGIDAFTRSGRYMGQYRRQAAQDARDLGVLQSQEIRDRAWPFDVLALEQQMQKEADKGMAFKVEGGGGNISSMSGGKVGSGHASGGGHADNGDLASHGRASRGAGALGRAAGRMTGANSDGTVFNQHGETTIDTTTGMPIRPYTAKQAAQLNAARDKYNTSYNKEAERVAQHAYETGNGGPNDFRYNTGPEDPMNTNQAAEAEIGQFGGGYETPEEPRGPSNTDVWARRFIDTIGYIGGWQPEAQQLREWTGDADYGGTSSGPGVDY